MTPFEMAVMKLVYGGAWRDHDKEDLREWAISGGTATKKSARRDFEPGEDPSSRLDKKVRQVLFERGLDETHYSQVCNEVLENDDSLRQEYQSWKMMSR